VLFNTLFGFSTSFWMAVTTRFLLGSLNGVLGPIKFGTMANQRFIFLFGNCIWVEHRPLNLHQICHHCFSMEELLTLASQ
ncbi:hypothetical protein FRX31_015997, partial [Thalictrum thalictroides]